METFEIMCGNWIFPAKDSSSGIQYPIEEALVVEIFPTSAEEGAQVSGNRAISHHLRGPRFLKVVIIADDVIRIDSLKNPSEELFEKRIEADIQFDRETLSRIDELYHSDGERLTTCVSGSSWNAIFFTSILLQAHKNGLDLPKGISFRKASMPEVEALGRW